MEKASAPPRLAVINGDTYSSKVELAYNGSREDLDPYVPSDHRPVESNTSSFGALTHLLKASLGSGVLAMPLAFKSVGLLVGSLGTIFIGFICGHSIHILVKTSQQLCMEVKKPSLGYAATCELVFQNGPQPVRKFASFARETADWALAITHSGACCVYVIIIASLFREVIKQYELADWSVQVFCALTLIVLVPLTQIRNLKYLVPFSTFANFVWLASICIALYYCLRDPLDIKDRKLATDINGLPKFISTCLFAMEGIGVVMPIENEMKKPRQFLGCPGVLNISIMVVVVMYGFIGFTGYLKYGEAVAPQLILNLPTDEVLAQTVKILVACMMLFSFALVYYVPVDVFWRSIQQRVPARAHVWAVAAIRLVGTLLLVAIACAVPHIEFIIEFIGAVCLSAMGLLIPAVVETVWRWDKDITPFHWVVIKNAIIGVFAIVAMVSGVAYAILELIAKLEKGG